MKDYTKQEIENGGDPRVNIAGYAKEWIDFCLGRLYADQEHTLGQEVVDGLAFEELIGALLAGQKYIEQAEADYDFEAVT